MDALPLHLQARIYIEAGVNGVCTASREEVLRCLLHASQRNIGAPFDEGEDGPAPRPTWRIAHMVGPSTGGSEAQLGAALRRAGQRVERLQHISVSVGGGRSRCSRGAPRNIMSGLLRFVQHVAPTLVGGTRLTIRGLEPALSHGCRALPWQLLCRTPLGAACTRLDLSADESAISCLLEQLADSFPVVRDVRVRSHRSGGFGRDDCGGDRLTRITSLIAPDSLARLTAVLWPTHKGEGQVGVWPQRARGLQELVLFTVPPSTLGRRGVVDLRQADAPALHTVRGQPGLLVSPSSPLPALRHVEAALLRQRGLTDDAGCERWLLDCQKAAPGLVSMRVLVPDAGEWPDLMAWAASHLGFALEVVSD